MKTLKNSKKGLIFKGSNMSLTKTATSLTEKPTDPD